MSGRRNPVLQWMTTSSALVFLQVASLIPLPVARAMGRGLGRLAYSLVPRVTKVGRVNLDLAYGDTLSNAEKERILLECCKSLATIGVEFAHIPNIVKHKPKGTFEVRGLDLVDSACGAVGLSAHLGNWELYPPAFRTVTDYSYGVVRPLDDPRLDRRITQIREIGGMSLISKDAAGPELIKRLRAGDFIALLADQSPRENGVPATFFGQPCWATVAPAMIALRARVPLHPISIVRRSDQSYLLEVHPPLEFQRTGNLQEDILNVTQKCQDAIEVIVRKNPEQWLWLHHRWKARPRLEQEWNARLERSKKR